MHYDALINVMTIRERFLMRRYKNIICWESEFWIERVNDYATPKENGKEELGAKDLKSLLLNIKKTKLRILKTEG